MSRQQKFHDEEEWAYYLSRKLGLEYDEYQDMIIDLGSGRAYEYLEDIKESKIPKYLITEFKKFFHIEEEEEEED